MIVLQIFIVRFLSTAVGSSSSRQAAAAENLNKDTKFVFLSVSLDTFIGNGKKVHYFGIMKLRVIFPLRL